MIDTGGTYHADIRGQFIAPGLTLLDHFAGLFGQALVGAEQNVVSMLKTVETKGIEPGKAISMIAYEFARDMIAEKRRLEKEK